ncbi:MAG: hypothetical protein M3247_02505 [Thermoproteota archaeon]|nr:hypothetical protein [Thermoproteota archaeon]
MEHYDKDANNNNLDKKTAIKSKMYRRFITTVALPTILLLPTLISAAPTYPVQAVDGSNETAVTQAPGGASVGPAANGTNATTTSEMQSACLPQNATTTTGSRPVNASGGANTTTINNATSATVAPSGASIGASGSTISNPTAGKTTRNTAATVAPSGASIC